MTSEERPLTRREARERERLLEQQAASSTPDAAAAPTPAAAPPVQQFPVTPPQPPVQQAPIAPAAPAYATPRSAARNASPSSPFGGAVATPAPTSPFAPPPEPVAPPQAAAPVVSELTTPERTLTRRELRAMLDASSAEAFDLEFADETVAAPSASAPVAAPATPFPPQPAPMRAPAPHQVAESARADEPVAAPKPVGHWTDQLNAPVDRAEPFDQLLSRGGVSHGVPTTTNALILPTLPDQGPMGNSLASSGEVIVTGSIDLPRSYGATGVHPSQIDSSDVDRLFDQVEDGAGVGAPIAATRAISTQGAARAMMAPPKKEGMNVPLVLAVTAGVLALGVVATLVIGAVAGLF